MTTANAAFIVDDAGRFPTFCAVAFRNERQAAWVDVWVVKTSSDAAADYARGQCYADEAIRTTGQPAFIECVLLFMSMKLATERRAKWNEVYRPDTQRFPPRPGRCDHSCCAAASQAAELIGPTPARHSYIAGPANLVVRPKRKLEGDHGRPLQVQDGAV